MAVRASKTNVAIPLVHSFFGYFLHYCCLSIDTLPLQNIMAWW